MAGGESGGQAPVCDHGGRSAGLVRDPNGPQSQWLGHRRKPHKARRTGKPGDCIAIPTAAALLDQERHELTQRSAYEKLPEFKGDPFEKADFRPFAPRRDPVVYDGTERDHR